MTDSEKKTIGDKTENISPSEMALQDVVAEEAGTEKGKPSKEKKKTLKALKNLLIKTALLIAVIVALVNFVITPYRISDNSMYPNIHSGDLGMFYHLDEAYIDNVILYKANDGTTKVGRIIATEGQTIQFFESGGYEVNGYTALEKVPYDTYAEELAGTEITLNDDEYFILNDYRSEDDDSRTLGVIKKDQIIGKLVYLLRLREF